MKAIQFTIDEGLLAEIDADPEVQRRGRSAFLRMVVRQYLGRRRRAAIREAYQRGYGQNPPTEEELGPWANQAWPDE